LFTAFYNLGKVKTVRIRDGTKTKVHKALFHLNTFQPSNMPIGKRLKRAIHALKAALKEATVEKGLDRYVYSANETMERTRLVAGPAIAVFPTVSLSANPAIITAPGEIILKRGEKIDMRVRRTPNITKRNSAQSP
jgi:hypothetical protein